MHGQARIVRDAASAWQRAVAIGSNVLNPSSRFWGYLDSIRRVRLKQSWRKFRSSDVRGAENIARVGWAVVLRISLSLSNQESDFCFPPCQPTALRGG